LVHSVTTLMISRYCRRTFLSFIISSLPYKTCLRCLNSISCLLLFRILYNFFFFCKLFHLLFLLLWFIHSWWQLGLLVAKGKERVWTIRVTVHYFYRILFRMLIDLSQRRWMCALLLYFHCFWWFATHVWELFLFLSFAYKQFI